MRLDRTDIALACVAAVVAAFGLVSKYPDVGGFHKLVIIIGTIGWFLFAGRLFLIAISWKDE